MHGRGMRMRFQSLFPSIIYGSAMKHMSAVLFSITVLYFPTTGNSLRELWLANSTLWHLEQLFFPLTCMASILQCAVCVLYHSTH